MKKPTEHLYWARTSSNMAPPPKPISAEEAKKMENGTSGGSAWNKSGNTWEEKKINTWAQELLKDTLLPDLTYELPGAAGAMPALPKLNDLGDGDKKLKVRVLSVESVSGDCTYVLSRGKQRVVFELVIKLQVSTARHGQISFLPCRCRARAPFCVARVSKSLLTRAFALHLCMRAILAAGGGGVRGRRAEADSHRQAHIA